MQPTLSGGPTGANRLQAVFTGDRVFVPKYETWLRRAGLLGQYERGAIVVFREPSNAPNALRTGRRTLLIKRVVGVPGDRVRIEAGQVYVNGTALDQSFITGAGTVRVQPIDFPKVVVDDGTVEALVMGFNDALARASVPVLPWPGSDHPAVPIDDQRVQLYYGTLLANAEVQGDGGVERTLVVDFVVPEGTYFLLGDNRSFGGSEDSRFFGPVDASAITGRATAVIWPPFRAGQWNLRTLAPPDTFATP